MYVCLVASFETYVVMSDVNVLAIRRVDMFVNDCMANWI